MTRTINGPRLTIAVDETRATLSGRIDDVCPFGELAAALPPQGPYVLDLEAVTFVNSIGLREWNTLLRTLRPRGAVHLERVPEVIITQMNVLPQLAVEITVLSFKAQYACAACGAETAVLVDAIEHAEQLARMQAPPAPCLECGAEMALADFPERYLSIFRGG